MFHSVFHIEVEHSFQLNHVILSGLLERHANHFVICFVFVCVPIDLDLLEQVD